MCWAAGGEGWPAHQAKLQGSAEELYPARLGKGISGGIQQQSSSQMGWSLSCLGAGNTTGGNSHKQQPQEGENLTQTPGPIGGALQGCEGTSPFLGMVVGAQIEP